MIEKFERRPYVQKEADVLNELLNCLFNEWDIVMDGYKAGTKGNYKVETKEKPKSEYVEVSLGNGLRVKDVIINEPAVVVRFNDGTKVVSKVDEQDTFSPEMGLLLGICKKLLGSSKTHELLETYVWRKGNK